MDTYALVLNAGSSSLKFCVFQPPAGRGLAGRGAGPDRGHRHVAPRMTVKDARATKLVDEKLDPSVRDGRAAIDTLAGWLRSHYQGGRIVGVGHRVVHGGPRFSGPDRGHAARSWPN